MIRRFWLAQDTSRNLKTTLPHCTLSGCKRTTLVFTNAEPPTRLASKRPVGHSMSKVTRRLKTQPLPSVGLYVRVNLKCKCVFSVASRTPSVHSQTHQSGCSARNHCCPQGRLHWNSPAGCEVVQRGQGDCDWRHIFHKKRCLFKLSGASCCQTH